MHFFLVTKISFQDSLPSKSFFLCTLRNVFINLNNQIDIQKYILPTDIPRNSPLYRSTFHLSILSTVSNIYIPTTKKLFQPTEIICGDPSVSSSTKPKVQYSTVPLICPYVLIKKEPEFFK